VRVIVDDYNYCATLLNLQRKSSRTIVIGGVKGFAKIS
jgi:hypothetical protein